MGQIKRAGKREISVPLEAGEGHGGEAAAASRQLPVLLHRTREALAVHFRKIFVLHDLTDPPGIQHRRATFFSFAHGERAPPVG